MSQKNAATSSFFRIGKFFRGIATTTQTMLIVAAMGVGIFFLMVLLSVASEYGSNVYFAYNIGFSIVAYIGLFGSLGIDCFAMALLFVWTRKLAESIKIAGESKHVELLRGFAKYMNICFTLGLVMLSYFGMMCLLTPVIEAYRPYYGVSTIGYIVQLAALQESLFAPAVVLGVVGFPAAYKNWKKMDDFLGTIDDSTTRQVAENGLKRVRASHVVGFIATLCGIFFVIEPIISVVAQTLYRSYGYAVYDTIIIGLDVSIVVFICILAVLGIIGGVGVVTGFRKIGTAFQGINEQAFDRVAGVAPPAAGDYATLQQVRRQANLDRHHRCLACCVRVRQGPKHHANRRRTS